MSKNLKGPNEKHFGEVKLLSTNTSEERILGDDIFGDITFGHFTGEEIDKIGINTFNKTINKITAFRCTFMKEQNSEIFKILNQMTQLIILDINLNVPEIPKDAFAPSPSGVSSLYFMAIALDNEMVVRSGAFRDLNQISVITFYETSIKLIENRAFKLDARSTFPKVNIEFDRCNLTGETFQRGAFDAVLKPIQITFYDSEINYLNKEAFKSVLENGKSEINFGSDKTIRTLDCGDCRNYWLIKENKQKQVQHAYCKGENKTLFDVEIKTRMSQVCK